MNDAPRPGDSAGKNPERGSFEKGGRARRLGGLLAAALGLTGLAAWAPSWWPVMVGAAGASGALVVLVWRRKAFSALQVLALALALRAVFLVLPPVLSDDGTRYVWDGALQVEAGINPYRYAPQAEALSAWHDAPVYDRLNSAAYHSVYPPASQLVFCAGALLYDAFGWRATFYLINALFALMEGTLVWVLYRRGMGARALLLYALHPLVLLEGAGQGHTEAGAALLLVLAVVWARDGRGGVASAALAGATLFKLYPLVCFPFLWRRFGARGLWPGALVGALLGVPYLAGADLAGVRSSLDLYVRLFEFNAGPYYALKGAAHLVTGVDWSKTLGPALRAVFVLGLPALYVLDARRQWSLADAFFWTVAFFLLCATTVHPWYLTPLLALAAVRQRPVWAWQWLGLCAVGTYLFYAPVSGAANWYWAFVVLGWGGAAALGLWRFREAILRPVLRRRARHKARRVAALCSKENLAARSRLRILDLGAGEGYVGAALRDLLEAEVVGADVGDFNRTDLSYRVYDGRQLPFEDDAFDVVVLYFVLHHAEDARAVLREALRVAEKRVIVAESVYESERQRRVLTVMDRLANRLRCGGSMSEGPLRFRRAARWRRLAEALGAEVVEERRRDGPVHPQLLLALAPG